MSQWCLNPLELEDYFQHRKKIETFFNNQVNKLRIKNKDQTKKILKIEAKNAYRPLHKKAHGGDYTNANASEP